MRAFSPTAKGFQLIFSRPAIPLAEIAWRWSIAIAAWFLGIAFLAEFSSSLPVNTVDRLLLGTQQPALILRALQRIFHGSAFRFTESGILLGTAMTVAWIVITSLGRAATLKAIIEELGVSSSKGTGHSIFSLLALNCARSAVTLAAVVAAVGAILITSGIWASTHLSVSDGARLWLLFLFLVWLAWTCLNWFLSTAAIFVVADDLSARAAIAGTIGWCREQLGSVIAAGIWFGLAHGGALIVACGAGFTVLSMTAILGMGPALFLVFLIVAVYSAVADFLYIGRLAAYVSIARAGEISDLATRKDSPISGPRSDAVDQNELILSDVPLLAT